MNNNLAKIHLYRFIFVSIFYLISFITPIILVGFLERPPEWFLLWSLILLRYLASSLLE